MTVRSSTPSIWEGTAFFKTCGKKYLKGHNGCAFVLGSSQPTEVMHKPDADFLAQAKHAEEQALKTRDQRVQDLWRQIASGYRAMAEYQKAQAKAP